MFIDVQGKMKRRWGVGMMLYEVTNLKSPPFMMVMTRHSSVLDWKA